MKSEEEFDEEYDEYCENEGCASSLFVWLVLVAIAYAMAMYLRN